MFCIVSIGSMGKRHRPIYVKPDTHRILFSLRGEKDLTSIDAVIHYLLALEEQYGR